MFALLLAAVQTFCTVATAPSRQPQETVLAGQVEVSRLVDLSAQRLKLNVEYDAAALKSAGQVTLRLDAGLTDEELWTLTNRVLIARGFATVRVPGKAAYTVVKLADATAVVGAPQVSPDELPAGFRAVIVRAKHRTGKEIADALAKLLSKAGGTAAPSAIVLTESAAGGLVLISDTSARIDQALSLIAMIDVAEPGVVVEDIPVRNYSSQQMATLVAQVSAKRELVAGERTPGEVVPSPDGGSVLVMCDRQLLSYWKDLITGLDKRERLETATYGPRHFSVKEVAKLIEAAIKPVGTGAAGPDDRWKLVTDELTGSIIVSASPAQHEQIRALIQRLDAAPASVRRPVRSFVIRNRSVREVLSILEQLVHSGVLAAELPGPVSDAPPAPAGVTPWPPAVAQPAATPMPSTPTGVQPQATSNTAAPPPTQPLPRSVTQAAAGAPHDRRVQPELILSADEGTNTLIAMGEPRLLSQIESLLQSLDVRQAQVMLEILMVSLSDSQTLDLGVEIEALGATDDVRTRVASLFGLGTRDAAGNRTAGDGLGLTGVVLNPGDFSVVMRALQTLNKGRSLSMPRLLVTNNQQATLDSVLEQPFASTNASNTVTTTSFGGTKPAGTQITLKPQIAEGDHLLLDYNISLSSFVGAAANASLPPPRQENKVQSAATLPDGHTVVLGGIELNAEGKATNQVPGIARIPIVGELFKNRSNTSSRSRFYVFIRANILRHGSFEDLKYLGEVVANQSGIDDGWPVVEPRVIR